VLLYSAGILTRSFLETWRADLGFERKPMLAATVSGAPAPLAHAALERVAALPGVTTAAIALRAPLSLSGGGQAQPVVVPGRAEKTAAADVKFNAVSANYFGTLGIRVAGGRVFDSGEDGPGPPVVVVNEQFVRQFLPPAEPVGAAVRLGVGDGIDHRVVGVVRNTVINQIGESVEPYCYLPFWRDRYGEATILIASSRDAAALAAPVRDALRRTDSRLEPLSIVALADLARFAENISDTTLR
jgi:putative ABC transport system permease protein